MFCFCSPFVSISCKSRGIFWTRPVLAADHLSSILPSCKTICTVFQFSATTTCIQNWTTQKAEVGQIVRTSSCLLSMLETVLYTVHVVQESWKVIARSCSTSLKEGNFVGAFFLVFWDPFGEVGGIWWDLFMVRLSHGFLFLSYSQLCW